ncbi:hypothetical protein CC80DRAFT_227908 [Byssothecium circinans]|uniref:Uncharacterized protein n=1 Tax=Byssothecium circinans TaxID=147558 RepID=A0A6A5TI51_9PLEO|nr:hypothetical protein CC80DRAFT_227908 [Byssothecium circinans]
MGIGIYILSTRRPPPLKPTLHSLSAGDALCPRQIAATDSTIDKHARRLVLFFDAFTHALPCRHLVFAPVRNAQPAYQQPCGQPRTVSPPRKSPGAFTTARPTASWSPILTYSRSLTPQPFICRRLPSS